MVGLLVASGSTAPKTDIPNVSRERLPMRRKSFTDEVKIGADGQVVTLTYGLYEDGTLGEVFLDVGKTGSALELWMGHTAMLFSIALQHKCPLDTLIELFLNTKGDPSGKVEGHPKVKECTSIMDFVARAVGVEFLGREDLAAPQVEVVPKGHETLLATLKFAPYGSGAPFSGNGVPHHNGHA